MKLVNVKPKVTRPIRPWNCFTVTRKAACNSISASQTGKSCLSKCGKLLGSPQLRNIKCHHSALTLRSEGGSALATSHRIRYIFVVPEYVTSFGQVLKVVGSCNELGSWDASKAPYMSWSPGHRWYLDVSLPRTTFEFKVVMLQDDFVRWEQGVNRVVQTDSDEDGRGDPVEIIVRVDCYFDQTESTQLALLLPADKVKEAFEIARATFEMLEMRRKKLQEELESDSTRQVELGAMREALAGQYSSINQLTQLLQVSTETISGIKEAEEYVPLTVARVPAVPRSTSAASSSTNGSLKSISTLSKAAVGSLLPPGTVISDLLLVQDIQDDESLAAISALGYYDGEESTAQQTKTGDKVNSHEATSEDQDGAMPTNNMPMPQLPDVQMEASETSVEDQLILVSDYLQGSKDYDDSMLMSASDRTPEENQLQRKVEAAQVLDSVTTRMRDFFDRNPSPSAEDGGLLSSEEEMGPSGPSEIMRAQVQELTSLMAEAEVAWDLAQQLAGDEEESSSRSDDNSKEYTKDQGGSPVDQDAAPQIQPPESVTNILSFTPSSTSTLEQSTLESTAPTHDASALAPPFNSPTLETPPVITSGITESDFERAKAAAAKVLALRAAAAAASQAQQLLTEAAAALAASQSQHVVTSTPSTTNQTIPDPMTSTNLLESQVTIVEPVAVAAANAAVQAHQLLTEAAQLSTMPMPLDLPVQTFWTSASDADIEEIKHFPPEISTALEEDMIDSKSEKSESPLLLSVLIMSVVSVVLLLLYPRLPDVLPFQTDMPAATSFLSSP
ncbi:hypothetical protein CEUSTIGMA_g6604.t1 [Chlamydomonas eustigma]|uniref:CBM20 domain-containing protein n=1 Tax=Chlamydomonas eustigma TaxID=1157962 RepID=A0A250X7V7_9CHLO|nr:hypothetical protein CEUSTIGMA_g6604.t1 [Chlamydomonas eustigma]|eukprot:GAX79164.1 hypothetical protein CEUSTIGMA_g6604.t1 [Chlamydomonas eustigma]